MKPPRVYDVTIPSSHMTIKITNMVQSIGRLLSSGPVQSSSLRYRTTESDQDTREEAVWLYDASRPPDATRYAAVVEPGEEVHDFVLGYFLCDAVSLL